MSTKPIFVATHPRACSTAFERVFMTRRDILDVFHEPFGDPYYFGPERMAARYMNDEKTREESGYKDCTYKTVMDEINDHNTEGKRILIKDMAQYFVPPNENPSSIAPSLFTKKRGVGTDTNRINGNRGTHFESTGEVLTTSEKVRGITPYDTVTELGNPSVVPNSLLKQFHFVFLIRHPINSIPSYYRCCIPPLEELTGFHAYDPVEAGYLELRTFFDHVRNLGLVGPKVAGQPSHSNGLTNGHAKGLTNGHSNGLTNGHVNGQANGHTNGTTNGHSEPKIDICVIDADDLLDNPTDVIQTFCESVGIEYSPEMLKWNTDADHEQATQAFEKWKGFHEDVIESKDLKPRKHKHTKSNIEHYEVWVEKYGKEGAEVIRKSVDENLEHYQYLKQFAMEVTKPL